MNDLDEKIQYHIIEIEAKLPQEVKLSKWLQSVADFHEVEIKGINYIFCSDEYLLDINITHLNHDYYTDIITFPYRQGKIIESDIFISVDRVVDNAQSFGVDYQDELLRVMAHGLLHLIGFADKSEEEASEMRNQENHAVALFHELK